MDLKGILDDNEEPNKNIKVYKKPVQLKDIERRYLKDAPMKAPNPIKIKFMKLFKHNYCQRFNASSSDFLESTHAELPSAWSSFFQKVALVLRKSMINSQASNASLRC